MRFLILFLLFLASCSFPWSISHAQIQLSRLYIDPSGVDTGKEWIALHNSGTGSILIEGWILDPNNLPDLTFPLGTSIPPEGTLEIHFRSSLPSTPTELHVSDTFSNQNISNTSGFIALYESSSKHADTIIDYVAYGAPNQSFIGYASSKNLWQADWFLPVQEGMVHTRTNTSYHPDSWQLIPFVAPTPPTPEDDSPPETGSGSSIPIEENTTGSGTVSIPTMPNNNPIPIITIQGNKEHTGYAPFSFNVTGEDSYDPDRHTLTYIWDFGNGETSTRSNPLATTYTTPGTYTVVLTVTDSIGAQTSTSLQVTVLSKAIPSTPTPTTNTTTNITAPTQCTPSTDEGPLLSELFPNPDGDDTDQEWIELYNPHEIHISLCQWSIADTEGRTTTYTLPAITLAPHSFYIIESSISKISLNNTKETVLLSSPLSEIKDSISYTNAPSGKSYSRIFP